MACVMAEVHVVGQFLGGSNFGGRNICCKWRLVTGPAWELLEGESLRGVAC